MLWAQIQACEGELYTNMTYAIGPKLDIRLQIGHHTGAVYGEIASKTRLAT